MKSIVNNSLIGANGAKIVADCLLNCHLEFLNLCKKLRIILGEANIKSEGAIALAQVLPKTHYLKELNLRDNNIGDQEVKLLAKIAEDHSVLKKIDLSRNLKEKDTSKSEKNIYKNTLLSSFSSKIN